MFSLSAIRGVDSNALVTSSVCCSGEEVLLFTLYGDKLKVNPLFITFSKVEGCGKLSLDLKLVSLS